MLTPVLRKDSAITSYFEIRSLTVQLTNWKLDCCNPGIKLKFLSCLLEFPYYQVHKAELEAGGWREELVQCIQMAQLEYYELMWAGNLDIAMQKLDWSQNMSHEFWLLQITKCDI